MNKFKVLRNKHTKNILFSLGNEMPNEVKYSYLGQMATADPNHELEIQCKIGMGWGALWTHAQIMESKLPLSLKIEIYNQSILSVLTYGAETWRFTKQK